MTNDNESNSTNGLNNITPKMTDIAHVPQYHELKSPRESLTRQLSTQASIEKEQHRNRFLSDAENALTSDPIKTRESFESVGGLDKKLWHLQSLSSISKRLSVDFSTGISQLEADNRLVKYGPNKIEAEKKTPLHVLFMLQFANLIVLLLLFATIAALALKEYVEGLSILFVLILNAMLATYQERSASNALEALISLSSPQCVVLRDNQQQHIPSDQLVPGDIVIISTGGVIPADIRLITSSDLKVNEMLLTGESGDVSKKYNAKVHGTRKLTADNMVFSSTTVAAGNGIGVVVDTGMTTRVGSIAKLLHTDNDGNSSSNPVIRFLSKYQPKLTPLQRALHHLGVVMGVLAFSVCFLVFIVGLVRGNRDPKHPDRPVWLTMIMVSVSLAVSAVPSGLPVVVTICLSSGTATMAKKHVLVRKLAAVETLGAASVICTDKTGTLTEGKMTAVKLWGDFKEYSITGKGFNPVGDILYENRSQIAPGGENIQIKSSLLTSILCSNTKLIQKEENDIIQWLPLGNSSEAPLVVAAAKAGIWEEYVQASYKRVAEIPFSSSRKMMITVNETPNSKLDNMQLPQGTKLVACVKGAPNCILNECTHYCKTNGEVAKLTEELKKKVIDSVDTLSSQALRVLAVACRPLEALPFSSDCDDIDEKFSSLAKDLILMGMVASMDPERDGVKDSIETARNASLRTIMITGDYLKTAVAIARNIGLLDIGADIAEKATDCIVMRPNGDQYLSPIDIDEITSRTLVFARAKPEDKLEIVRSLQRQGLVVAMTGDGVNDAPALKEADIGVAMGISGTEVAKGASDMVLTDDNFCSIVSAVERGRVIYANIQKFVIFLLSTNIGEILLLFSTISAGMPLPLEPLQILVLNIFSDGMPAIALSLEQGEPKIMEDQPRPKSQQIIHGRLWVLSIMNSVIIVSTAMTAFVLGLYWNFGKFVLSDILNGEARDSYVDITCNTFQGPGNGWSIIGDCNARLSDGRFLRDVSEDFSNNCEFGMKCVALGIGRAQTMTFVCITMTEVFRAYTVRSFTDIVFKRMFSNRWMQMAALASIVLTIMVTNIPVLMDDVLGFRYIEWYMWLVSLACAINSVFWGEIMKWIFRSLDTTQRRWRSVQDGFEIVLLEVRNLRHHVERLENELDSAGRKPFHSQA